tara:strand:+ start:54 stop:455 length:402 start_codon:yes stop_codon:yes gene_type:complete
MPSLDRVDIRSPAPRTEIVKPKQSAKQRQELAANGNIMPIVLTTDQKAESNSTELDQAIETVAGYVQNIARDINFSIDETTNEAVVTVTDQESGKVIRQIPTEEMLEISKNLENAQRRNADKVLKGLLFVGDA